MKSASDIVLKVLGVLLLVAACLKGWQLMTEPVANSDIWSNRAFLIFTVEFEITLGIWLLSGIFKKASWLIALACFALFSVITLYKGLSGAASCGCFGSVQVNPWITLFAIDIPAVLVLLVFRPKDFNLSYISKPFEILKPAPSTMRLSTFILIGFILLSITTMALAFNEPAKETQDYVVLEPETWIGKKLPILKYIDIGNQLTKGNWLVLFYHHDCPDCIKAISTYEQMAEDLAGNEDFMRIAFIETPPYGRSVPRNNIDYSAGKLSDAKEWFVSTPAVIFLENSVVRNFWDGKLPSINTVLDSFAKLNKSFTLENHASKGGEAWHKIFRL